MMGILTQPAWRRVTLLAAAWTVGLRLAAEPVPSSEPLLTAAQIRQLTPDQAARHLPVHLQGVITFLDLSQYYRFLQDETAGIYFTLDDASNYPALKAGAHVEIDGVTSPGQYAPVVTPRQVRLLGECDYPPAKPVTFEQVISGAEDSQFVEISGLVRSVRWDAPTGYFLVEIATGGGRLTAMAAKLPVADGASLVDSTVRLRGVCVTRFNLQRQLFDTRLLLPRLEDLAVVAPAPADPFAVPNRPLEQLLQFTPQGSYGHRVKVRGTVIYHSEDGLYIEDKTEGLLVATRQGETPPRPGDEIEALGFPAKGEYTPMLQDAVYRIIGRGDLPTPDVVTSDEARSGRYDCRLVRMEATVLDRARHSREQFLVLQSQGSIFNAYLQPNTTGSNSPDLQRNGTERDFAYLQNGAQVAITGVCLIERGNDWYFGTDWRAKSFRLLMRSPADIAVLKQPPWWTIRRMLWALGLACLVVLTALAWVGILRRRVSKQTAIIRRQLETEAALKERYENLFENASDMVFTQDLTGHITSINRIGEQILRCPRKGILGRDLAAFVAEDQRDAVRQWLAEEIRGGELATAEWDFVNAAGQRLRLEISALLVQRAGSGTEVESVARDITERSHLEREILETSNREQRRIGHDLHDGVCQQLVAIAYRMDIVGEQLEEKGVPESAELTRIGGLLNEAIQQTRGVARGLFPVRLAESGLESALEELAANINHLFKIQCQFKCEQPLPSLDSTLSLHLYYIAQEAVSNAVRHGKATQVNLTLTGTGDRFTLEIQDNGSGFRLPLTDSAGMGIRIMRYRARVIGATLNLKSEPNQGTQIAVQFNRKPSDNGPQTK
jgi:PAS domain S-box-containing protein